MSAEVDATLIARIEQMLAARMGQLEQMINERHTRFIDVATVMLAQNQQVVTGLSQEFANVDQRLDQLIGALTSPIGEISALRADLTALERRVEALERRPTCALMTDPRGSSDAH